MRVGEDVVRTNEDYLLKIKKQVEHASKELGELEGRKKVLLEQLETKYGLKSSDEVEVRLDKLKEKLNRVQKQIEEKMSFLQENFSI